MEIEKLANEKTEMQRHYVMYYEMSYGLNVEMHKQTEIAKRLNAIIAQILPYLQQERSLSHHTDSIFCLPQNCGHLCANERCSSRGGGLSSSSSDKRVKWTLSSALI
ncbi:hypothetical protein TYRP_005991 [Tyrophagus putrescentiae]|nr:hypothetical protein TYRP_005991 [Tyrophagus putrescentiae]